MIKKRARDMTFKHTEKKTSERLAVKKKGLAGQKLANYKLRAQS